MFEEVTVTLYSHDVLDKHILNWDKEKKPTWACVNAKKIVSYSLIRKYCTESLPYQVYPAFLQLTACGNLQNRFNPYVESDVFYKA